MLPWTVQAQPGLKVRCRRAVLVLEMSALVRAASVIYTFGLGDGPTARRASAPLIAGTMEGVALASDVGKRGAASVGSSQPRLMWWVEQSNPRDCGTNDSCCITRSW